MKKKMIPEKEWQWYGYAGHFIMADRCQFHLCTRIGAWLVSSVGMCIPEGKSDKIALGASPDSFFETYVFRLTEGECAVNGCGCGVPNREGIETEGIRAATAGDATVNHMRLCREYARMQ